MTDKKDVIPVVNLKIIRHNGKPAIEIRKIVTDIDAIKKLVSAAYHDQQLIVQPNFTNKPLALNRLIDVGLVHVDKGQYHYLF